MSSRAQRKTAGRERLAEMRAAQERAERRRRLLISLGAVALVVVVVAALVVARLTGVGTGGGSGPASRTASPALVKALHDVPASSFDRAGTGGATNGPRRITAPALTADGKPRVLYVGAEYCPFCAAERWAVAVALSRFGTFSDLGVTHSSSSDTFPNTPTLSFHGARYSSDLISFSGVETTSNKRTATGYEALDQLSDADDQIVQKYDQPPYVKGSAGGIPFVDIGGRYVSSGASYDPGLLAGKTQSEVAKALSDPSDPVATAVNGSANLFTAAICQVTRGKPAAVCGSSGVRAALKKIGR